MKLFFIILTICALGGIMIFNYIQKTKEQKHLSTLAKARNIVVYIDVDGDEEMAQEIARIVEFFAGYANNGPAPPIKIQTYKSGDIIYADVCYAPASLRKVLKGVSATVYFY